MAAFLHSLAKGPADGIVDRRIIEAKARTARRLTIRIGQIARVAFCTSLRDDGDKMSRCLVTIMRISLVKISFNDAF